MYRQRRKQGWKSDQVQPLDIRTFLLHFLTLAALTTVTLANSFTIPKFGLYVVFGAALLLPLLRPKGEWGYHAINMSAIIWIAYSILHIGIFPQGPSAFYNGILAAAAVGIVPGLWSLIGKQTDVKTVTRVCSQFGCLVIWVGLVHQLLYPEVHWESKAGTQFLLLYFIFCDDTRGGIRKAGYLGLFVVQSFLGDERGFLLACTVLVVAYWAWPIVTKHRAVALAIFALFFVSLISVPMIYVWLSESEYRAMLDQIAMTYTQGRFFSGRDVIWSEMLSYARENVIFGGGHAVSPSMIFGHDNSAHNTFVSVLSRTGMIGLGLFFLLFLAMLLALRRMPAGNIVRWGGAFMIAVLFKQSSELSLLGNNVAGALLSWIVFAYPAIYHNATDRCEHDATRDLAQPTLTTRRK